MPKKISPPKKKAAPAGKRLILLDAHAILHRAYHALPDFTSPSGEPTGGLYGLAAMILKIVQDLKPDYLVACFDLPKPTYRHEVYEAYKAGRAKTDDALAAQIERSRDVFAALNIPIYEAPGFEADDGLGTICSEVAGVKDLSVIIASGDMDTMQLIDGKRVQVYTLRKGIQDTILYDEQAVKDRFGFPPKLLPDFKGLRGDPSDNIVGIRGIGEKTATTLIVEFGTIEKMYKALKKSDAPFRAVGITPRIIELLRTNEEEALFSKMLATIRRDAPINFSMPPQTWRESFDLPRALALFTELGFRTPAVRLRELFAGSASAETSETPPEEPEEDTETTEREYREAAIALWLLNSDISNPSREDVLDATAVRSMAAAHAILLERLRVAGRLRTVFEDIELPLLPLVERIQTRGIKIDRALLADLSKRYHKELAKVAMRIYGYAGEEFNINSPKQLGDVLFDRMQLTAKNLKRTDTGARSTRESELEKMRELHPIIADILDYRELQKLLSTYIDNLPRMLDEQDRLHTTFVQAGTTTGRMASQNPNLQNIPIRSDLGRNIRRAFVADTGFMLVSIDYSQIELRVAAFLSQDEKLLEIFRRDGDAHRAVAAQVFHVPEELVDAEMRRRAKVINFGILYGMGVNALRANLGTDRAEAQRFYNEYFATFADLARYLERTKIDAAVNGYTETYFGRRRSLEGIRSSVPFVRASAERMAINAPIQGTQADIIKIAMARIDHYLDSEKLQDEAHMLLQVHDELVFEIKNKHTALLVPKLKEIMESVLTPEETHGVKLIAEARQGASWGEMEKMQN